MPDESDQMSHHDYLDFEVEVGLGSGREYPVAVDRSPAGEARATMRFPFDELALTSHLKDLEIALLRSGGKRRRILSTEERAVEEFGRALFGALLTGDVRSCYDMSQREAAAQGKGLRLKLRIQPPDLAALPWEFLYDPRQAEYVCLSRNTPLVRYPVVPQPIQPLAVQPPLRILGMIASPRDQEPLDVMRERQRMEAALKDLQERSLIDLTWLEGQTWRDLHRAMGKGSYHIFHFIGHGGFDPNTDEGLIALADEEGKTHCLSATQVGRLLADHRSLKLVLLNSCEGARGSQSDVFSSTAAMLVRRGIPAVLAMQYEITDRAAIEFAHTFYQALADGMPVDAAVANARIAVSLAIPNTLEWGTPVLYMRSPDGRIFDIAATAPRPPKSRGPPPALTVDEEQQQRLAELYTKALSAFYTGRWEQAIALLEEIAGQQADYEDAASKLKEAKRQQQLAHHYAAGVQAAEAHAWAEAVEHLQAVHQLDSTYKDAAARLAAAKHQKALADLYTEARRLHQAHAWQAVINVLERIKALDADYPDPDNLLASAHAALEAEARKQELAVLYSQGLRHIDAGEWSEALQQFEELQRLEPGYGETEALLSRVRQELAAGEERQRQQAEEEARLRAQQRRTIWRWLALGGAVATLLMLVAVVAIPAIRGATSTGDPTLNPNVSGTINFWHAWQNEDDTMRRVIDICEKQLPKISINPKYVPHNKIWEEVNRAAVTDGSSVPDVIAGGRWEIKQRANDGSARNLGDYAERDGVDGSQFWGFTWEQSLYDGDPYGIPYQTDVRVLYWNRVAFREVGLPEEPPTTWGDLEKYADKLDKRNQDGSWERIAFSPLIGSIDLKTWGYANGVQWITEDGEPQFTTLEAVETLEWLKWWIDHYDGWQNNQDFQKQFGESPREAFISGKIAMLVDITEYARMLPQATNAEGESVDLEWDVSYLPYNQDHGTSWSGGFDLSIPRGAKNPDAAWEFIKCATGREAQIQWARDTYAMPTNKAAAQDPKLMSIYRWQFFVEAMDRTTGGNFPPKYPSWNQELSNHSKQVWTGELTPQQALEQAQKAVEVQISGQ